MTKEPITDVNQPPVFKTWTGWYLLTLLVWLVIAALLTWLTEAYA